MYLENVVFDAVEPQRLGRFWAAAVGGATLTDQPDNFETRVRVEGGPELDLCFQPVSELPGDPRTAPPRLHLDLAGGEGQTAEVQRLLGLGARHLDIGQHEDLPWVVLADPEGNPFCVLEQRAAYADTGPIATLPLDSADPDRDVAFWGWLTGWNPTVDQPWSLRHPSRRGPVLALCPEPAPKQTAGTATKNRLHLDVRLQAGEDIDGIEAAIAERGGRRFDPGWGVLPWRSYTDPSGNEFCVLPAPSSI